MSTPTLEQSLYSSEAKKSSIAQIADAPKPVGPYSHVVEAGDFPFVTGPLATDPDDDSLPLQPGIEAQTRNVFDNLKGALAGVGAKGVIACASS
jgi:enamine deaminase RidA (YjgF/YER057c/UK114 family)